MAVNLSVCVDAVFENQPLEAALSSVADCGYKAFEFWKWWDKDLATICRLRDRFNLKIAACCTKFVSLVDATQRDAYLSGLQESIAAARQLDCPTLISQVGDAMEGVSRDEQHQSLIDGLKGASRLLRGTGVTLAIEPLNVLVDHPGYYLIESVETFEIIREVDSPSIKVTFDIYHQQISEGNVLRNIMQNLDLIAHFHAAGNPGRHELSIGEINYPNILEALNQSDYQGFFGLEYWPVLDREAGLRRVLDWV